MEAKQIHIKSISVNYIDYGERSLPSLVLIHGWGQSLAFWSNLLLELSTKYRIIALDLPGFGQSGTPGRVWRSIDYAEFLHLFLCELGIQKPSIIGHSFGGRIAGVYAAKYDVKKLILYSASGDGKRSFKKLCMRSFVMVGLFLYPNVVYRLFSSLFKPKEYINNAIVSYSRSRRIIEIYLDTHPESVLSYYQEIKVPTLMLNGVMDKIVDYNRTKNVSKVVSHGEIHCFKKSGHFAHISEQSAFLEVVKAFLVD